jgi:hypothetical protein
MKTLSFARTVRKEYERVSLEDLADDFLREHRINGRKSDDDAEARWDLHLKSFFGALRAGEISSSLVAKYIESRQKEGGQNATINRELASLECMFNFGREHGEVCEVPIFPHLEEEAVPKGYLEDGRYRTLVEYSFQSDLICPTRAGEHDCTQASELTGSQPRLPQH